MEISGRLHTSAVLPCGEKYDLFTQENSMRTQEPVRTFYTTGKRMILFIGRLSCRLRTISTEPFRFHFKELCSSWW